jgi:hypothetical protein
MAVLTQVGTWPRFSKENEEMKGGAHDKGYMLAGGDELVRVVLAETKLRLMTALRLQSKGF